MVVFFKTGNQVNYFILIQRIFNSFLLRSHVFETRERPTKLENNKIINLNVRGKRGNIVQVYPAVEYDFVMGNKSLCRCLPECASPQKYII